MRPLAPYRSRPIRTQSVRKVLTPEAIRKEVLLRETVTVKGERVPLKLAKPVRGGTLKVLGKADSIIE